MAKKTTLQAFKIVEKQLNVGYARFLINTQSKFSASAPVQTGRLASSFVIGKDNPDRYAPPERDGPGPITPEYPENQITLKGDWYISSNLPYSRAAALDPKYKGRRGSSKGAWFSNVVDSMPKDLSVQLNKAFRGRV